MVSPSSLFRTGTPEEIQGEHSPKAGLGLSNKLNSGHQNYQSISSTTIDVKDLGTDHQNFSEGNSAKSHRQVLTLLATFAFVATTVLTLWSNCVGEISLKEVAGALSEDIIPISSNNETDSSVKPTSGDDLIPVRVDPTFSRPFSQSDIYKPFKLNIPNGASSPIGSRPIF